MKKNDLLKKIIRDEPYFEIFLHKKYLCCLRRGNSFNWCGYVAVEENHPFYGKDYAENIIVTDKELDNAVFNGDYVSMFIHQLSEEKNKNEIRLGLIAPAHGGLTYARDYLIGCDKEIFHKKWWFGFDTAHCDDLLVSCGLLAEERENGIYRDFEYTKKEVENLVDFFINHERKQ
jgi:hypothetical protein